MPPIKFTVPAVPIAQPRPKKAMVDGRIHTFTPEKHPVNAFKATCRMAAREALSGLGPLQCPVGLWVTFVLPRPAGMTWKRRAMPRARHVKKPDLDNLQKSLKDALKGIAWRDDSQVCEGVYDKVIAAHGEQPHVEVAIYQLSEVITDGEDS